MEKAELALKTYYGYSEFRPMQAAIIEAVLAGKDCMVLMPTGGGKSVCFQIPALIREGVGIVVSPLIALMKDQVEGMKAMGIRAAFINSSRNASENNLVERQAMDGELDLLYVSPEKLLSQDFSSLLSHLKPALFAIDEAHCISQWGHDFRPEYTQMRHIKERFPDIPMIALTATADRLTRKDILEHLGLRDPEVFISSFDRPNLSLAVLPGINRYKTILDFVKKRPGMPGIIYCLSRKSTEEVAAKLEKDKISTAFYHAGMSPNDRAKAQERFIRDDVQVICATIAFGMGIDKPNVRWVIHYNMPKNIESYYQEIGRSGRDGLPSETLLLYSFADVVMLQDFIKDSAQADILRSKLDRMQQYADARTCRRRILLSYFSENPEDDCGNCDVCQSPPARIDGTILAQKALSAVMRTDQAVGSNMLVDVLRGSSRQEIVLRGYDRIKTYGAGADISRADWLHYVLQMLNMGLFEIAYDDGNVLKITPAGMEVLKGKRVDFVKPLLAGSLKPSLKGGPLPNAAKIQDGLFQKLRELRKMIADSKGVPPYMVFGDNTLKEMSERMPVNEFRMRAVSGVGEQKFNQYGEAFINAILAYVQEQGIVPPDHAPATRQPKTTAPTAREKGASLKDTYDYYQRGMSLEQIAGARGMSINTIAAHFQQMYAQDVYPIDIFKFMSTEDLQEILTAAASINDPGLKPIFDALEGRQPYEKIRFALAYRDKQQAQV